jgi:hypothetical protein
MATFKNLKRWIKKMLVWTYSIVTIFNWIENKFWKFEPFFPVKISGWWTLSNIREATFAKNIFAQLIHDEFCLCI